MSTTEIKGGILEAVAKINNRDLLLMVQEIVNDCVSREGDIENGWEELPIEIQNEIDKALVDIEDEKNLVSNEEVMKKYKGYLK